MSRFTSKERLKECPSEMKSVLEHVESFNDETTLDENTEYLIVGTLTPPKGRGKGKQGYFYCSPSNKMYRFIGLGLEEKKAEFNKTWNPKLKEEIKGLFTSNHIAFLDVVDEAYAKKNSSRDDDIECYTLAVDAFEDKKNIIENPKLKIVANSLNAYDMLLVIFEQKDIKRDDIKVIPQQLRGYTKPNRSHKEYHSKEDLQKAWDDFFGEPKMIGAIIGDVVGSRFEFNNIKTKEFELITPKSRFTDDTVLTIAVMDILNSGDFSEENIVKTLQKWGKKYPHAGYGGRFRYWIFSKNPKPTNSYGNGSAMRISPVGWFATSEKQVEELATSISEVTHNHPEGIKGAVVTAMCIYKALHGKTKEELRKYIVKQYPEVESLKYDELLKERERDPAICQISMPIALYCFLISKDFEDCLRTTISVGGDTDTNAAISCAIAEAYYKRIPSSLICEVKAKLSPDILEVLEKSNY